MKTAATGGARASKERKQPPQNAVASLTKRRRKQSETVATTGHSDDRVWVGGAESATGDTRPRKPTAAGVPLSLQPQAVPSKVGGAAEDQAGGADTAAAVGREELVAEVGQRPTAQHLRLIRKAARRGGVAQVQVQPEQPEQPEQPKGEAGAKVRGNRLDRSKYNWTMHKADKRAVRGNMYAAVATVAAVAANVVAVAEIKGGR